MQIVSVYSYFRYKMQQSDPAGYDTLLDHFSDVCESGLDPATLARGLFQKRMITADVREAANQLHKTSANKLEGLLDQVMANGSPGAFESFVQLVGKDSSHSWLSEKLKGMVLNVCIKLSSYR